MVTSGVASPGDHPAALEVWRLANAARRLPPARRRIERVREKLADSSACVVVVRDAGVVVGMALAEPYRDRDGAGSVTEGAAHISMVFVDPSRWGTGLGGKLLKALHDELRERGWDTVSVWTRASNHRAHRLYERHNYQRTGETKQLAGGDEIVRFVATSGAPLGSGETHGA
jgi:L-amino acid N-acyltransferase YncA